MMRLGFSRVGKERTFHDECAGDPVRWRRRESSDANLDRRGLVYMQVIQTESKSDKKSPPNSYVGFNDFAPD